MTTEYSVGNAYPYGVFRKEYRGTRLRLIFHH